VARSCENPELRIVVRGYPNVIFSALYQKHVAYEYIDVAVSRRRSFREFDFGTSKIISTGLVVL